MASRSSAAARALARAIANGARSSRPAARSGAWRSIEQLAVPLSRGAATCAVANSQQSTSTFLLPFAAATVAAAWTTSTAMAAEAERTFIAIKPDGVQRGLIADIVERFERKGYKLVAIKLVKPTKAFAEKHYHDLKGRPFFNGLTDFLSSGPVVAMVWEGPGVITYGRKLIGATNPQASEPGTIRGDLAVVTGRNVIHGSDGPETAKAEIALWFKPEELVDYELDAHKWVYE